MFARRNQPLSTFASLVILGMAGPTFGQTAGMLSFQGVLKDVNGAVVNGPVALQFRIYDTQSAGNLVDMDGNGIVEDVVGKDAKEVSTAAANGIVSTKFGPVSPKAFGGEPPSPRWLEVRVNGTALSRTEMATAPATAEQVNRPGTGRSAIHVDANGYVGIGTAAPTQFLDVNGIAQCKSLFARNAAGQNVVEIKGSEPGQEVGVIRVYNDDGVNVAVLGGLDGFGTITLRDDQENPRIVLRANGTSYGGPTGTITAGALHLTTGSNAADPSPVALIQCHSDYTHPNRTALEIKGGVTDSDPRYFRVYTDGDDPYSLKASLDGKLISRVVQITGGSDLAEPFAVTKSGDDTHKIEPGMVVVIDPRNPGQLKLATQAYDRKVAGIISGANGLQPGMVMKAEGNKHTDGDYPVALTGRVWCWCDAQYGPIQPGDRLTTSATPGHAMRITDRDIANGAVIGKAMTVLSNGTGLVLVLVQAQ